jgi:hypothetical protein
MPDLDLGARRRLALASRLYNPSTEFSPLLVYHPFSLFIHHEFSFPFIHSSHITDSSIVLTHPFHFPLTSLRAPLPVVSNATCPMHSCPRLVVPAPLLFHLPSLMISLAFTMLY